MPRAQRAQRSPPAARPCRPVLRAPARGARLLQARILPPRELLVAALLAARAEALRARAPPPERPLQPASPKWTRAPGLSCAAPASPRVSASPVSRTASRKHRPDAPCAARRAEGLTPHFAKGADCMRAALRAARRSRRPGAAARRQPLQQERSRAAAAPRASALQSCSRRLAHSQARPRGRAPAATKRPTRRCQAAPAPLSSDTRHQPLPRHLLSLRARRDSILLQRKARTTAVRAPRAQALAACFL
jgi:hypothetical protein